MKPTNKYTLNNMFVFRAYEGIVFDTTNFIVHEFNDIGLEIISLLEHNSLNPSELGEIFPEIQSDDIKNFIAEGIKSNILVIDKNTND